MACDENCNCNIKEMKSGGLMKQREPDLFSIRLRVVGGRMEAAQLAVLAELAERYGRGHVHLTTRQGAEIPFVHFQDIETVRAELARVGLEFGACGARVRTITACQGGSCLHGLIDPQALAKAIDARVYGRSGLPHKFKIAITGCPNACIKPQENDLGIMGVSLQEHREDLCTACGLCAHACPVPGALAVRDEKLVHDKERCVRCGACAAACPNDAWQVIRTGYALFAGGKMGKRPRLASRLAVEVRDEQHLLRLVDATIDWYAANGKERERLGDTLDRIGVAALEAALAAVAA